MSNPKPYEASFVVPTSLKWTRPKYGPRGTRKEFRLPAITSSYSTNSDKIVRFTFNNSGLVDFRRGFISFDLTLTTVGGTYRRLSQGVWSIFNRLVLKTGSTLEDIREYNLLHSLLFECTKSFDVQDVLGPDAYGYATQAVRNAKGLVTTNYSMPLICGFMLSGIVPLGVLQQVLQLELYIDEPTKFVETDGTNPVVTLTNIFFHYEVLSLGDEFTAAINSMTMGSGLCYPFRSFTYYTQPVITANSNLVIPHSSSGIESYIHVMRRSDTLNNTTVNDKFITWNKNDTFDAQLRFNNEYFPLEPVKYDGDELQGYITYLRWIDSWRLAGIYTKTIPTITAQAFNTNRFVIVNQVETHPDEGLVSDKSTTMAGNNVFLRLQLNAPPPNPTNLETFVQWYNVIEFKDYKLL